MSARTKIVNKLVELVNDNLDGVNYLSNVFRSATNRLIFWDEVSNFPSVSITAGNEQRQYLPSDFKWGFLNVNIRVYVQDEYPQSKLEQIIEDLENLIDANNHLEYDLNRDTELISIIQISTDEGLLSPTGVAELTLVIQYEVI